MVWRGPVIGSFPKEKCNLICAASVGIIFYKGNLQGETSGAGKGVAEHESVGCADVLLLPLPAGSEQQKQVESFKFRIAYEV